MSKSYVLSNGKIQVGFDQFGQVYDFYFPYVGLENQIGRLYVHKIGVFVDKKFHWLDDGSWEIHTNLHPEYNSGCLQAINHDLQVEISFEDVVYNEKNIFIRHVKVTNTSDTARNIKVYFNQQFELYESYRGDTAYFDPDDNVIVHFKGRRIFIVNAINAATRKQFEEYSIGLLGIEGKEGTYRDAEDGQLSFNPIEHGLADSVIGLEFSIDADQTEEGFYWLACGKLHDETHDLDRYVRMKTPEYLMHTAKNYWRSWIKKNNFTHYGLDDNLIDLFHKSLFILRSHADNDGAMIASGDSDLLKNGRDAYSYMWPRDGAYIATALDNAGYHSITKKFFEFCNDILTKHGYFLHKYRSDQSVGSSWHPWIRDGKPALPIQEDETAGVLYALWHHYEKTKDIEFIESIYNSLIKKSATFLTTHIHTKTGLPLPSYDLWEEKYGVHTYTAANVYGALLAAAKFAEILGKHESRDYYIEVANNIAHAIDTHLYNYDEGYFYKSVLFVDDEIQHDTVLDMSSLYGLLHFDVYKPDDDKIQSMLNKVQEQLTCKTGIGGLPRYENDNYFRTEGTEAGNPWIITTLWLAQYYIEMAQSFEDLEPVIEHLHWVHEYASPSGMIAEQLNPITGQQLSATPLAWSHAEYVSTIIYYLEKLEALGIASVYGHS